MDITRYNLFGEKVPYPISSDITSWVEQVLRDIPASRDNDMILYAEVWKKQGLEVDKNFVTHAAKPETIGRHRRFLQQRGFYSSKNPNGRIELETAYRGYYEKNSGYNANPSQNTEMSEK